METEYQTYTRKYRTDCKFVLRIPKGLGLALQGWKAHVTEKHNLSGLKRVDSGTSFSSVAVIRDGSFYGLMNDQKHGRDTRNLTRGTAENHIP